MLPRGLPLEPWVAGVEEVVAFVLDPVVFEAVVVAMVRPPMGDSELEPTATVGELGLPEAAALGTDEPAQNAPIFCPMLTT
jgi:hypothetical protein